MPNFPDYIELHEIDETLYLSLILYAYMIKVRNSVLYNKLPVHNIFLVIFKWMSRQICKEYRIIFLKLVFFKSDKYIIWNKE